MKRILLAYILIAVVSGFLFLSFSNYKIGATESKLPLHSEIFKVGDGYGYQIELESRVLIKQEYIPILKGKKPFATSKDAKRTADKIIYKLQNKESPILTISELKELQITATN